MNYNDVLNRAKENMEKCNVCPECDCKACAGRMPGPGGKGSGSTAVRNRSYWKDHIKLNQDVLVEARTPNTEIEMFGKKFSMPVFVAPLGMIEFNFGKGYDEYTYSGEVLKGAEKAGTLAFTGGGAVNECFYDPLRAMDDTSIKAIPTLKPWRMELVEERISIAEKSNILAMAMDIDSAGLPHSNVSLEPMMAKSPEDIARIVEKTKVPFIVKGIMTAESAVKAADAGAYAIVVSNHGGRVMDDGLSTAEILKEIKEAVGDRVKVLVDGGIRNGGDVCKAIALGADAVLIGRPCATAIFGGGSEGLALYLKKIESEIKDVMKIIGCYSIDEITEKAIRIV